MSARIPITSLLLFVLAISLSILICPAQAKNKKKQTLPDVVLNAQRVYVVIRPEAGEPVTNPRANRIAQNEVERALSKWHRFDLVMESTTADLVIAVSKGHSGGPMITNMPDDRPVVFQSGGVPGAGVRLGGRQGQPPDLTAAGSGNGQPNRGPQLGSQVGPSEDTFEVYLGGMDYPLDAPPIWRYTAKNSLDGPGVVAVEQFKKAIEESEKQRQKP
jgi:hypothetical protein